MTIFLRLPRSGSAMFFRLGDGMNRLKVLTISAVLSIALTACGASPVAESPSDSVPTQSVEDPETPDQTAVATTENYTLTQAEFEAVAAFWSAANRAAHWRPNTSRLWRRWRIRPQQ